MTRPTLGVVLCVYNQADWLQGALEALTDQRDPADAIVVVDDGSTDASGAVAERFECRGLLRLLRLPKNVGVIEAGRAGLDALDTDFVGWFSADDRVMPGIFTAMRDLARARPGVGVLASAVRIEAPADPRRARMHPVENEARDGDATAAELARANRRRYTWFASSGAFVRRDALLALGGWRREFDMFCDWFAVYAIALRHGAAWTGAAYSVLRERPDSFGSVAARDPVRRARALDAIFAAWRTPEMRDVRAALRAGPLIMTYGLGERALARLARDPRDWDLVASALPVWLAHRVAARFAINRGA
jgi:glycosyltransferase involved in cell wall biosynthesis